MSSDFPGRIHRSIAAFGLALVVSTIALGQTVTSSYLPGADFSKYRTYRWVTIGSSHPNPDVDAEIKRIVDLQLAAKGLARTDNKSDLTVGYRVALSKREEWPSYRANEINPDPDHPITVTEGTLGIVMHDSLNQLVWNGTATSAVDPSAGASQKQKNLDKYVKKLLEKFPPKQHR